MPTLFEVLKIRSSQVWPCDENSIAIAMKKTEVRISKIVDLMRINARINAGIGFSCINHGKGFYVIAGRENFNGRCLVNL
jgi:hypothetical protein